MSSRRATAVSTVIVAVVVYLLSLFESLFPFYATLLAVIAAGVISGLVTRNPLYGGVAAVLGGGAGQAAAIAAGIQITTPIPQLTPILFRVFTTAGMFAAGIILGTLFRALGGKMEEVVVEEKTEVVEEEEAFKVCKFCNEQIPVDAIFCPFCGHKLVEESVKSE